MGIGGWELDDAEFARCYGPWTTRTPQDATEFFAGYPGLWWIAGGWAIQAFTGVIRDHDDCDPSVLGADLELLRAHARGRMQLWSCASGALRPVFETLPRGDERLLLPDCFQVWARPFAGGPWEFDILLSPGDDHQWVYRRDPQITMPMRDALWERDGITYLRPQIQLLYKAAHVRPKDQRDFDACLPLLSAEAGDWLLDALLTTVRAPHPWVQQLRDR